MPITDPMSTFEFIGYSHYKQRNSSTILITESLEFIMMKQLEVLWLHNNQERCLTVFAVQLKRGTMMESSLTTKSLSPLVVDASNADAPKWPKTSIISLCNVFIAFSAITWCALTVQTMLDSILPNLCLEFDENNHTSIWIKMWAWILHMNVTFV